MKLTFWGAVQTVTGSMHELRVNGTLCLLDCGLFQAAGRKPASVTPIFRSAPITSMRSSSPTPTSITAATSPRW